MMYCIELKTQFEIDVAEGLTQPQKQLSSKYFYDEIGDKLFQDIMAMPEYYLTRAEDEIFTEQSGAIIDSLHLNKNQYFELIDLGAGDGTKTIKLLRVLLNGGYIFAYIPVDISESVLEELTAKLKIMLPGLTVKPKQGTYFGVLEQLNTSNQKVVLFLGSNIGNLLDDQAQEFLHQLGENLSTDDHLLLGVDLIKSKEIVLPAYNDAAGITKAFNLNLLKRMNRELDANFDLNAFDHAPQYDEEKGIALSYIRSLKTQNVVIKKLDLVVCFEEGELIHTEISRKYNTAILNTLLADSDFVIQTQFKDKKELFCDYLLKLC